MAAPVFAAPLGSHFLVEGRFNLDGFFAQTNRTGPYNRTLFKSIQILQLDYIVNSKLTLVFGQSMIPFDIYLERLSQLWQQNFQDGPQVAGVGTKDKGTAVGMQARGNIFSNNHIRVNYVSWFSKRQNRFSLNGTRAIGDRVEIFFPNKRIEVDASFTRRLQDARYNNYGAHFTWLPYSSPLQVRGEYAHNPNSQGYWIENSYRLSKFHGVDSFIGRIEPIFRFQQAFRNTAGPADGLPRVDTKIADFGLDYNLPHDVRIKSSYSRKFAQGADGNIWNLSVTYRFLYPAWPGRKNVNLVHIFTSAALGPALSTNAQQPIPIRPVKHAPARRVISPGERVFLANCSRCHNPPDTLNPRITGTVIRHMRVRANSSAADERELLHFFNP